MTDIGNTARPDVLVAGGRDLTASWARWPCICALWRRGSACWSGGCPLFG
jgi:hypothetical protein